MVIGKIQGASPSLKARIAGFFYFLVFVTAVAGLITSKGGAPWNIAADACYVVVSLLFFDLFNPVNRGVSSLAAFFSLAGCSMGILEALHLSPFHFSLVLFGLYCILIGYLVLKSVFLPPALGIGMMFAGLGWLTFISPWLVSVSRPYNMAAGILGEAALFVWLMVMGVNDQRWEKQSGR
jgi:hypothetical protein